MTNNLRHFTLLVILSYSSLFGEGSRVNLEWRGQVSVIHASSFSRSFSESPTTFRYIPQWRVDQELTSSRRLGFDAAVDMYNYSLGDSLVEVDADPYRLTLRYDTPRTQLRVGLQKINFGPARMLRVLQWFDELDPRDPLALSPGVWALMGRNFFDNGANIRLWSMVDAPDRRRVVTSPAADMPIDIGGRLEYPLPAGTLGLTLHSMGVRGMDVVQEQRGAIDLRVDAVIGLWTEVMFSHSEDLIKPDQVSAMVGVDYTFGIGNGLYLAAESNIVHMGDVGDEMPWVAGSTALMGTYNLGLSDGLTAYLYAINIVGRDTDYMPTVGWQHTAGNWLFYLALYDLPQLTGANMIALPAGTGAQLNIAFNH